MSKKLKPMYCYIVKADEDDDYATIFNDCGFTEAVEEKNLCIKGLGVRVIKCLLVPITRKKQK